MSRFVIQIADMNGIILKREDSDITNIAEWWKTCSEELSPYVRENDQPRVMALEAFCVDKKGLDLFMKKYEKNFFPNVDTYLIVYEKKKKPAEQWHFRLDLKVWARILEDDECKIPKTLKFYHERYGERLQEIGFIRKRSVYYRIYGEENLQILLFKKEPSEKRMYLGVLIQPLYRPDLFQRNWTWKELPYIDFRQYYEYQFDELEDDFENEDAIIEQAISVFQRADTAKNAYDICKQIQNKYYIDDIKEEGLEPNLQYYALRCGEYEVLEKSIMPGEIFDLFNAQYLAIPEYFDENFYLRCCQREYYRDMYMRKLYQLVQENKREVLDKILDVHNQSNRKKLQKKKIKQFDYKRKYDPILKEQGFTKVGDTYWRIYGDHNFQAISFDYDLLGEVDVSIGLCPLYCGKYLERMVQKRRECDFFGNFTVLDIRNYYLYTLDDLTKYNEDDMVRMAIRILDESDTAENCYHSYSKLIHSDWFSGKWCENVKSDVPECLTSCMFYYAVKCKKYDQILDYVDFYKKLISSVYAEERKWRTQAAEESKKLHFSLNEQFNQEKFSKEIMDSYALHENEFCIAEWIKTENEEKILEQLEKNIEKNERLLRKMC